MNNQQPLKTAPKSYNTGKRGFKRTTSKPKLDNTEDKLSFN